MWPWSASKTWGAKTETNPYHSVPLCETHDALQGPNILARTLDMLTAVKPGGIVFVVVVFVVVIVVMFVSVSKSAAASAGRSRCVAASKDIGHRFLAAIAGACAAIARERQGSLSARHAPGIASATAPG